MRKSEIVRALWANYRASGLTVVYAAVAGILIGKNGLYYPLAWAVIAFAAFVSLIDSALTLWRDYEQAKLDAILTANPQCRKTFG